jgi:transcription elongation factor Elf1
MSKCPNCGAPLSCGCQKKKASNGTLVCANCITKYERTLLTEPSVLTDLAKNVGRYKNLEKFIKK